MKTFFFQRKKKKGTQQKNRDGPTRIVSVIFELNFGHKKENVGIALFSRAVASQVFSAPKSLTTVFGMGTGGTSSSLTPTILFKKAFTFKIE